MEKRTVILIGLCGVAVVGVGVVFFRPVSVDSVMEDFHAARGRGEDMLMDPLILNADLVQDRVIQDIQNPEMDKRRYAIAFLGNERISEAMDVLVAILNDESEKDYFRGDALESIFLINEARGRELAAEHTAREDILGRTAKTLIDGTYVPDVRTKSDARLGRHD